MKKWLIGLGLILCLALGSSLAVSAQAVMRYVDGVHFDVLEAEQRLPVAKGEVLEFFSYGCPHCRSIAAEVDAWQARQDQAKLVKVPVVWNRPFRTLAQLHYALEAEGLADRHGKDLFSYIHDQNKRINQPGQVEQFVATLPVDRVAVMKAFNAQERNTQLEAADRLARQIGIAGVPSFVVSGRYRVSLQMAGSHQELFRIIDFLLQFAPVQD